ncbi:bucentaur or craniofacial development-domain-containing protein [Ganoderma leucocontextum]|nr:bucentaur or craniofacial development-domain-containing protein [Ganoderma leucocontextum]
MRAMDSDSEDDSDYVPPVDNANDNGSDADAPAPKRARTDAAPEATSTEDTAHTKTGDDVYAAFKASLSAPRAPPPPQGTVAPEIVKIVKRYREVVDVPADSDEAKKWPRWTPEAAADSGDAPGSSKRASETEPSGTAPSGSSATPASTPAKTSGRRPGPRKSKSKLSDVPTKKEPVKKLTTLDKSAMDWRSHVQGEAFAEMKDELDANRRGGGYLEKVEFLQRVEARKEDVLEASKGKRRR